MKLLTVKETSAYLNVDPVTVYRYMNLYHLPSYKLGGRRLFRQSDVDAWIESRKAA